MLILLITLILNQVNASVELPKNAIYSSEQFDTNIYVKNNEVVSAKFYGDIIPLTKDGEAFFGKIEKDNITRYFTVKIENKRKLLTEITEEVSIPKIPNGESYFFNDIELVLNNDIIKTFYYGCNKEFSIELNLNNEGQIASYKEKNINLYKLNVEGSSVKKFWCNECEYEISGINNNFIVIPKSFFANFQPDSIEMFLAEGTKKTIRTSNSGKQLEISVIYGKRYTDLKMGNTQFNIEENKIVSKSSLIFIARRTLIEI